MQPINKEVLEVTDTTISCVVSGITQQLDRVVWTKDGTDVTTLPGNDYEVSEGTFTTITNSQTTTLIVRAAANTADATYTCVITSDENLIQDRGTFVSLDVFCKFTNYLK